MAFKVLKRDSGLVGIDFGTTGIKILQVTTGDNPQITRMGFLEFPLKERESFQSRLEKPAASHKQAAPARRPFRLFHTALAHGYSARQNFPCNRLGTRCTCPGGIRQGGTLQP